MAEASASSSKKGGASELSREDERIRILELSADSEPHTKEGDNFYLMNNKWWQQWVEYIQKNPENITKDGSTLSEHSVNLSITKRPFSIDNSELVDEAAVVDSTTGLELHDTLMEGRDYILLPEAVWNQFHSWYGGGPVLPRKVISQGQDQKELAVEVYPLRLQLILMPKGDSSTIRISKKETVGQLLRRACDIFNLNSQRDSVQIWDYYGHQRHALLNDMDRTLTDANIQMDQDILVEVVNNSPGTALGSHMGSMKINGTAEKDATSALIEPSKSSLSIAGGLSASRGASRMCNADVSQSQNQTLAVREPGSISGSSGVTTRGSSGGLTGLLNLGNTCFMNSAIQCLVHTPEFAKYFQEDYHQEINRKNPLGMVGELALAFGELLRKLWAPGRTPIAPRQFKAKLARFAPQFSGYNQHDSQELLAFLLDGLHEDLNRVKDKPYIKSRDADGRPDEEVADEYWAYHTARNDSIIVDVCQGQYKSTLVCPECNKVSVTFDPFMYLSLPLQPTSTRTMTITVFACDGSALPTTCSVAVSKQGRVRDLIQALSNACSLKPNEKLLVAEIENHLIKRIMDDPLVSLATIKDDDYLAAYRMPKTATNTIYLRVMHHREDQEDNDAKVTSMLKPCGTPLVLAVSRDNAITSGSIQALVRKMLSTMLRTQNNGQIDVSNSGNSAVSGSNPCSYSTSGEGSDDISVSNSIKVDGTSSGAVTLSILPLQLLDEDGANIDLSVGEEKAIKLSHSSGSITVYLNWSLKLLQKYDTSHLENLPEVYSGPVTKKARTEPLSLYTCLEAFLREEPLVPEDMWYCPQCKERRQASKKLDLWRLPEVLVIHLKRFSYSRSMKHKLETFVNFPIHDFDLTNYIANKNNTRRQIYELYALTNHYGGMGSGHYTAYIKLLEENKWYNFDDSHISVINEDDVKSSAAYVLFYRRVKTDDTSVSNGVRSNSGGKVTSQR